MSDPVVLLSTGDVVGPAGGVTDNSMVLFSGTSGKLIKGNNAVVTAAGLAILDDVSAAAQKVTLGLGNVDNTSDINKPISTATQTALDLKATIASPTFTGVPSAPTASAGTRSTAIATMQNFANEFGSSLTANGYQKLPSGLIVQWGSHPAGYVVQSYPIAFPNAVFIVIGTATTVSDGDLENVSYDQYTVTGFRANGDAGRWLALGY